MGGVYEHVIRSVRKISRVLPKQLLLFRRGIANFGGRSSGNSQWPTNRGSPIDSEPLTSNHLLLLWSNLNLPPGVFSKNDLNCWCRWRQIHYLADVFWRWLSEYIPNFRERQKWIRPRRNFAVGDLVLIAEERVHRSQWPFARVLEVYPKFTQSRWRQSPLHSQGQFQSFVSSNKRAYPRRRTLLTLPDYRVVYWNWKAFEFVHQMCMNFEH